MTTLTLGITGPVAAWLVEVYAFATVLLVVAALAMLGRKQPADRLWVARATFVALALLGPLVAACRWARASTPPIDSCCAPAPYPGAMVGIFAGGSGLAVGWLVLGAVASTRLRRRSRPAPEPLRAILVRVAGQGGTTPRLLVGAGVAQPVAFGLIRPSIVLPERFAEREPEPRIESALAHEWAHVANGDLRLLALSRVLLPLLFAHPLFAWLRRRVRADQEALADLAASRLEGRIAYAEALLHWSRSGEALGMDRLAPGLGLGDRPSSLRRRIALLLDGDQRLEAACSRRWRLVVGASTVACLVGLGGLALGGSIDALQDGSPGLHQHTPISASFLCPSDRPAVNVVCCSPQPDRCQ
jgi:Zn-dependent protease with chaperone function